MIATKELTFDQTSWGYPNMKLAKYFGVSYGVMVRMSERSGGVYLPDLVREEPELKDTSPSKICHMWQLARTWSGAKDLDEPLRME